MECTVSWTGGTTGMRSGMGFVAETGSGHVVNMDGAPDAANPANGGQNQAPRPMEMLLAGAGGCTAYDVVLILKRGRHAVKGCSVKLTSERADTDPKVFTKIHMQFTVSGTGLPAGAVEGAATKFLHLLGLNQVAVAEAGSRHVDRSRDDAGFQLVDFFLDVVFLAAHLTDALLHFGVFGAGGAADSSFVGHGSAWVAGETG